jgi:hypothetical protein
MFILIILIIFILAMPSLVIQVMPIQSTKINPCNNIYYSLVQKTMIRNERPKNKILIDNMLKKMSLRSGVSPAIIKNCAKTKK